MMNEIHRRSVLGAIGALAATGVTSATASAAEPGVTINESNGGTRSGRAATPTSTTSFWTLSPRPR
jgi:hypothetical protein